MMKTYLRYVHEEAFGIITSPKPCVVVETSRKIVYCPAVHEVHAWDLRLGEKVRSMSPEGDKKLMCQVSSLALVPSANGARDATLLVGYTDGYLRLYSTARGGPPIASMLGHKGTVQAVCGSRSGMNIATGGADTDVIVWDAVSNQGVLRLKGHKDAITAVEFLGASNSSGGSKPSRVTGDAPGLPTYLISASKDSLVKVWELKTQHCVQTIVGHRAEVWALSVSPCQRRLITGTNDGNLRVWALPSPPDVDSSLVPKATENEDIAAYMGTVTRLSTDRCSRIRYFTLKATRSTPACTLVAVQSGARMVEVYRVRSEDEAKRKLKRRLRRLREKQVEDESELLVARDELELVGTLRSEAKFTAFEFAGSAAALGTEEDEEKGASSKRRKQGGAEEAVSVQLLLTMHSNGLEVHTVPLSMQVTDDDDDDAAADQGKKKKKKATSKAVTPPPRLALRVDLAGHRGDAKAVVFSHQADMLCSAGGDSLKVWNVDSRRCVRSVEPLGASMDALVDREDQDEPEADRRRRAGSPSSVCAVTCVQWLPGDSHIVVGTKEGRLLLVDLASGDVVCAHLDAHGGAISTMQVNPLGGLITGGADNLVKFWDLDEYGVDSEQGSDEDDEERSEEGMDSESHADSDDDDDDAIDLSTLKKQGKKRQREEKEAKKPQGGASSGEDKQGGVDLVHSRTLKMGDDVVSAGFSKTRDSSRLLLAVATLDSTVRVFFHDSLSFFLQLYGHKLPVFALDIVDDNTLIVTGSGDKTVKIWGLDFGDCHRSLLAHDDSVTGIRCVPRTHYFFSSSKDRTIKYWDADTFEQILLMDGHAAEVWGLDVSQSNHGAWLASCGGDRSLRLWARTDDPVFIEEEREKAMEDMFDSDLVTGADPTSLAPTVGDEQEAGEELNHGQPTRRSMESLKAGERLMESLELADIELAAIAERETLVKKAEEEGRELAPRRPNPLLLGLEPVRYILRTIRMIKQPELEEALLVLPFHQVERLCWYLVQLLHLGLDTELCVRSAVFLVRLHHAQLAASGKTRALLLELKDLARTRITQIRDLYGQNLAAMKMLKKSIEAEQGSSHIPEVVDAEKTTVKKKKKKGNKKKGSKK